MLNVECNTCQKSSSLRHGWPLNLIASEAGSFYLLTQFMSSHSPHFLLAISMILRSKNVLLVFFTVLQKIFQSSRLFNNLYFLSSLLQLLSHQLLECHVMLVSFTFLFHALSMFLVKLLTTFSSTWMFKRFEMFRLLIALIVSFTNWASSALSFWIVLLHVLMNSSKMGIVTVKGVWSNKRHYSG